MSPPSAEHEQWVRDEREWRRSGEEAEADARRLEPALRARLGAAIPADAVRVILPTNERPPAPQDPVRAARFFEHLAEKAEGAVLDRARLSADPAGAEAPANGRERLARLACGACRGNCCQSGGTHAYVTEETLVRVLEAHPDWTLPRLLEAYREHLPAETTRDSCVFHAATGCGLPRALRSVTCNTFLCAKLDALRASVPENDPPPVLALMFEKTTFVRAALLDGAGVQRLGEEKTVDRRP